MKQKIVISLTIIACLFIYGCSTSKGSLFHDTHNSDKGKKSSSETNENDQDTQGDTDESILFPDNATYKDEDTGLFINSYPQGAEVYLDYRYYGTTPLYIPYLETGNYTLELRLPGYKKYEEWIYYQQDYKEFSIVLDPIVGYFQITVNPADAEIYLGSIRINKNTTEVPAGSYALSVRKFGYTDFSGSVTIYENQTTTVTVELIEAGFTISGLEVSRKIFNPGNPGTLGRTTISFRVTSFGKANLIITDKNGDEVFSYSFSEFQTWYQYCEWNGRRSNGLICPDGQYEIEITATSKKEEHFSLSSTVMIDSSLTISYRTVWNGVPGMMYSVLPEILPTESFQVSSLLLVHIEQYNDELIMRAPGALGVRIGCGNNIEADIFLGAVFSDTDFIPFTGSAAVNFLFLNTQGIVSVSSSVYAKAAYHFGTGADTQTNFTGLSTGIPLKVSIGMFAFVINPELIVSPYQVTYTPDYDEEIGFNLWAYGRFGIIFDSGVFIAGLSGAIRTTSLLKLDAFDIDYPMEYALELHLMIPESSLYFSLLAATEFESFENYYIMGGIGIGFVY
jgi:hypothetical protein